MSTSRDDDFSRSSLGIKQTSVPVTVTTASGEPPAPPPSSRPVASDGGREEPKPKGNLFERLAQFIRDTRDELRRTDFPDATQVKNTTIITIIAVIFFAIYLFAVDQTLTFVVGLLERAIDWLLSLF